MLNRYTDKEVNLPVKDRPGPGFIAAADEVYQILEDLVNRGIVVFKGQAKAKYKNILDIAKQTNEFISDYEKTRKPFNTPQPLLDNYRIAKREYELIKKNPQFFYKENEAQRKRLESERFNLEKRIKESQLSIARREDVVKHDIKNQRVRLAQELAAIKVEKKKYEAKVNRHQQSCFTACFKSDEATFDLLKQRSGTLKDKIDQLGKEEDEQLARERYTLKLLNDRQFDVDKKLHEFEESEKNNQRDLLREAVDDTQVIMYARQADIDEAIDRHYSQYNNKLMHAFLRLYIILRVCCDEVANMPENLKLALEGLDEMAQTIHNPDLANRSVLTLYKKAKLLPGNEMQVIFDDPVDDKLPPVLERTLTVKDLKKNLGMLNLFKKAIPPGFQASESDSEENDNNKTFAM